ncbi:MAG: hypothetical protein ACLUHE_15660 [Christensenellales bacterium]
MEEKMQVSTEGKDQTIAFNACATSRMCSRRFPTNRRVMRFNSNASARARSARWKRESYLYLVLPVRVFNA